ncbi:hypothetical protein Agabi119p4_32 [Agaricus bisporus var. burnettii]|uniref:Uncharacterized protein n=1 Tax=Agaricus bisporus var. burnettii TaxID=192524 RepID=A0A8H7KKN5_AGABI|nr:hypothetical protein Agabi119p4_32 [Agaricus bisporus var. burnettii]
MDDDGEQNPRPTKRQKTEDTISAETPKLPHLTLANLLLSLPSLLLHPPTHTNHERSLALSYNALNQCNVLTSLDRVVECRAATGLVELGLQIGLSTPGVQGEIQKALTKASLVAQNLPSLHLYRHRISQLSSQLSLASGNPKVAQNNLKRALSTVTPNDPPHILYSTHLAIIASISSQSSDETTNTMRSLGAISDLHELASKQGHQSMVQLASVLRLRALVRSGLWGDVGETLDAIETNLDMAVTLNNYSMDKAKVTEDQGQASLPSPPLTNNSSRSTLEYALIIHSLVLGIIFYTFTGDSSLATPRLKWLHELLDIQLPHFPKTGIFEIPFSNGPPLHYQLTHPRVIYILGFLVSSLAKRDMMGRKPKKKVFASEGIIAIDKELRREIAVPTWASISDVREIDTRFKKLRADLMCEIIGASIMRSEFDEAERSIDELISYTRTQGIFPSYVARLTLHEAQLAHAQNSHKRALDCYQIASWLSRKRDSKIPIFPQYTKPATKKYTNGSGPSTTNADDDEMIDGEEDTWINAAARAGELWLRIGLFRQSSSSDMGEEEREKELHRLRKIGESVTKDCRGLGGTLEAIAEVLESCLTKEFTTAKTHLRRAMNLATNSGDNHLRALVLSLIASHFLHTSYDYAEKMLKSSDSLAAGLGSQPKSSSKKQDTLNSPIKGGDRAGAPNLQPLTNVAVGNAHLRLWIGERRLELYNRIGNQDAAKMQVGRNGALKEAVARVEATK